MFSETNRAGESAPKSYWCCVKGRPMRQITTGIADAHKDKVTPFEHRVLMILETAKSQGTHLNTRLVTLRAFDCKPPLGAIGATGPGMAADHSARGTGRRPRPVHLDAA